MDRARNIIKAYGADAARWPQEDRLWMAVAVEKHDELKDLIASEARLDTLLEAGIPTPMLRQEAIEGLVARAEETLLAAGQDTVVRPTLWQRMSRALEASEILSSRVAAAVMVSCLASGLWFGASLTTDPLSDDELVAVYGEDYGLPDETADTLFDVTGETL